LVHFFKPYICCRHVSDEAIREAFSADALH